MIIIGKRVIRPLLWRLLLGATCATFVLIALIVFFDSTSDVVSRVGAAGFVVIFSLFAVVSLCIGVARRERGIIVRTIGRPRYIERPAHVEVCEDSTWWGATYLVPRVTPAAPTPGDNDGGIEVVPLAMYALTARGQRKAEEVAATLRDWLNS